MSDDLISEYNDEDYYDDDAVEEYFDEVDGDSSSMMMDEVVTAAKASQEHYHMPSTTTTTTTTTNNSSASSPSDGKNRRPEVLAAAKHVAKGAGSTAKKLMKRTIKGGLKTTRHVFDSITHTTTSNTSTSITGNSDNGSSGSARSTSIRDHQQQQQQQQAGRIVQASSSLSSASTSASKAVLSHIERISQKSGKNTETERFKVYPKYAYPKTKFNREELRQEMNKPSSYFHDLRRGPPNKKKKRSISDQQQQEQEEEQEEEEESLLSSKELIGSFYLEVLQCFGIPRPELMKETSAFCMAVCGPRAFRTDTMPPVANPMWLSKMRRACILPLTEAYARVYLGVFAYKGGGADAKDGFIGRIVMDMARLRPGCTYDITLPLRQSSEVYSRQQRGAIRIRCHLEWHNERKALLSYLPLSFKKNHNNNNASKRSSSTSIKFQANKPHDSVTVRCCDNRAFQNVARVVHGQDLPGKFSMKLVKATLREINFVRIHLLRYLRKRQLQDLVGWRYPLISCFVFVAWMHSVIHVGDIRYVPGHLLTFLLLQIWKNYGLYAIDGQHDNGFSAPTYEELVKCLTHSSSSSSSPCIEPLSMERKDTVESAIQFLDSGSMLIDEEKKKRSLSLPAIANALRDGVPRAERRSSLSFFRESSAGRVFLGTAAVDFMVANQLVDSRAEAVQIGLRLQKELRLFEHVSRKFEFKDAELYYVFLNFDTSAYVFKTHRPWFRFFFRIAGFYNSPSSSTVIPKAHAHWEFPFATGADHPRFTVKDSLVIRSKEARNLLRTMDHNDHDHQQQEQDETEEAVAALGIANLNTTTTTTTTGMSTSKSSLQKKNRSDKRRADDGSGSDNSGSTNTRHRVLSPEEVDIEVELVHSDDDEYEEQDDEDYAGILGEVIIQESGNVEVTVLPKPPNQDINVTKKSDMKIEDQMANTLRNMHGLLGHMFHDKAYKLSLAQEDHDRRRPSLFSRRGSSNTSLNSQQGTTTTTSSHHSQMGTRRAIRPTNVQTARAHHPAKLFWGGRAKTSRKDQLESIEDPEKTRRLALSAKKDEYDRLLSVGKYSNNNLVVSKVAVIIQPIVEIAQLVLRVIRALFNIFTWRDPFLTFWVVTFGSILVLILHLFPWRIFLGVTGVVVTGPQNWIFRLVKERKADSNMDRDLDIIVRKRKPRGGPFEEEDGDEGVFAYFSSAAPDNRPIQEDQLDTSDYKEVAVPCTPLNYRRIYDWPPETEYARVWSCRPPESDPVAQELLEAEEFGSQGFTSSDDVSLPGGGNEQQASSSNNHRQQTWSNAGRKIVRGVRKVAHHAPSSLAKPAQVLRRRKSRQLEELESVSEL